MNKSARRFACLTPMALVLTGLGLSLTGCSSSDGGGGGTGGTTSPIGRLDAGTDTAPVIGTGGAGGLGGGGIDVLPGTGGTIGPDGGPPDQALPLEVGPEVQKDQVTPILDSADTATEDGIGPVVCRTPKSANSYDPTVLSNLALDQDGKLVTATRIFGTVPFNFGGKQLVSNGSADMLVAKLDPKTGQATWTLAAGDAKDQAATSVAATSAGIAVAGTFMGSLDLTNGTGPLDPIINPSTTKYGFLAGLKSTDGSPLWLKSVNLGASGVIKQVASIYNKDFFLVCGSASNNAAALGATGTVGGGKDVLLAAVNASDGKVKWAKIFGGAMDQECLTATLDDSGKAFFAGVYTGSLDFGAGALVPAPTDQTNRSLWVAELDGATGTLVAAKAFATDKAAVPNQITTNAQGDAVVVGMITTAVTFGTTLLTPKGEADAFAVRLTGATLATSWARRWGGMGTDSASAIGTAFDSVGNVTVVGQFGGSIDIGGPTTNGASIDGGVAGSIYSMNPQADVFIATLDGNSGQTLCARAFGDISGVSAANTVVINRWASGADKDSLAIAGVYTKVINFGAPTTSLASVATVGYLLQM